MVSTLVHVPHLPYHFFLIFRFEITSHQWHRFYTMFFLCDCTGTGTIECGNEWTQKRILDKLSANFPELKTLKKENYDQHFSIECSDKDEFKSEDQMQKGIKRALISAGIEINDNSILSRSVRVKSKHSDSKIYFYLLDNEVVKVLAEKKFKIFTPGFHFTFKVVEPKVLTPLDCFIHKPTTTTNTASSGRSGNRGYLGWLGYWI